MRCGDCKYWRSHDELYESHPDLFNKDEGDCTRVSTEVNEADFMEPSKFVLKPADSLFRIQTGESYCDGELITKRNFGCVEFSPGVYEYNEV